MSFPNALKNNRVLTFGPFRLRMHERVLEKDGQPVSIPEKTLAVLNVLVESPGQLVEKETLKQKVWPDTFVEDSNIAFQISTLRRLLDENASDPRFIATVPKRGYRFIAQVVEEPAAAGHEENPQQFPAAKDEITQSPQASNRVGKAWVIAAALIAASAIVGIFAITGSRSRSLPALAGNGTIVLADFDNRTGDQIFDGTLRQGVLVELEQSPALSLLPEQSVYRTLRLMKQPINTPLSHEVSMGICQRTGSTLMVEGYVDRIAGAYVLGLRGFSCEDGKLVGAEQAKADGRDKVLDTLSKMTARFRARLGETTATLNTRNVALAEATTTSLEALKAYSTGWHVHMTRGAAEGVPLLLHAVELDPEFAMGYATLGRMYADLDESDLSAQNLEKAWTLREHASDHERFFITANYLSMVKGNLEESRQVDVAWAQSYPRDPIPHTLLSGLVNKALGRYQEAALQAKAAIKLDPDFGVGYYNLAVNNLYMQRFAEAQDVLAQATVRGLDIDEFQMLEYDLAFLHRDPAATNRVVARIRQHARPQSWLAIREAFREACSGHLGEARNISQQAIAEAEAAGERERAGVWAAGTAVREALTGNISFARSSARQALGLSNSREVQYGAALALALIGDSEKAQSIATNLKTKFPEDTSVRFNYVPVIEAQIRLNHHRPDEAIEVLKVATITEMGVSRSPINTLFGALYPIYFRGLSLQALNQGQEAAAEFQKIIDHSGIVGLDPVGALAYLQLGRSYRLAGDSQKARAAYEQFLSLWRGADTNIHLFNLARSEYGQIRQTKNRSEI